MISSNAFSFQRVALIRVNESVWPFERSDPSCDAAIIYDEFEQTRSEEKFGYVQFWGKIFERRSEPNELIRENI